VRLRPAVVGWCSSFPRFLTLATALGTAVPLIVPDARNPKMESLNDRRLVFVALMGAQPTSAA
jgi:hypothetical protein